MVGGWMGSVVGMRLGVVGRGMAAAGKWRKALRSSATPNFRPTPNRGEGWGLDVWGVPGLAWLRSTKAAARRSEPLVVGEQPRLRAQLAALPGPAAPPSG